MPSAVAPPPALSTANANASGATVDPVTEENRATKYR
jgi:hypothetical protein